MALLPISAAFINLSGDSSSHPNGKCYFSKPRPAPLDAWEGGGEAKFDEGKDDSSDSKEHSSSSSSSSLSSSLVLTLTPHNYRSRLALYADGTILLQYLGSYSSRSCTTTVELTSGGSWRMDEGGCDGGGGRGDDAKSSAEKDAVKVVIEPTGLLGDVCVMQHGGDGEVQDFTFSQKKEQQHERSHEGKDGGRSGGNSFDIVLTQKDFENIYTFGDWSEGNEDSSDGE